MACGNITISGCPEGKWYARLPFTNCKEGYEAATDPITGEPFSGATCYCLADPEAKRRLDAENGDTGWLSLIRQYWYIFAAIILLFLIRR